MSMFGPDLVRQESIGSPKEIRASALGLGSTQGGGQPVLEAAGIEAAASHTRSRGSGEELAAGDAEDLPVHVA